MLAQTLKNPTMNRQNAYVELQSETSAGTALLYYDKGGSMKYDTCEPFPCAWYIASTEEKKVLTIHCTLDVFKLFSPLICLMNSQSILKISIILV